MATYTRNKRLLKIYRKPIGAYSSFGPVGIKPSRVRIHVKLVHISRKKKLAKNSFIVLTAAK